MPDAPSSPSPIPDPVEGSREEPEFAQAELAIALARGVSRTLVEHGHGVLTEFSLKNGRRVDVIGIDRDGAFVIVEIKTSLADFRSDMKWAEYLDFCDRFFFAVPEGFPQAVLPPDEGLMVADAHAAAVIRESAFRRMNGARRKNQTLRFAQTASQRLFAATQSGVPLPYGRLPG